MKIQQAVTRGVEGQYQRYTNAIPKPYQRHTNTTSMLAGHSVGVVLV